MNSVQSGDIILCHDIYDSTFKAMETVIPALKAQGYEIVTITELFAAYGKTLVPGQLYTNAR